MMYYIFRVERPLTYCQNEVCKGQKLQLQSLDLNTVETLIRTAALIHFSRNFGQNLLSKMRLLSNSGCYYSRYGICDFGLI